MSPTIRFYDKSSKPEKADATGEFGAEQCSAASLRCAMR